MPASLPHGTSASVATIVGAVLLHLTGLTVQSRLVSVAASWAWDSSPPKCAPSAGGGITFSEGATVAQGSTATIVCSNGGSASPATVSCPSSTGASSPDNGWWAICGSGNSCAADKQLSADCVTTTVAVNGGGSTTASGGAAGSTTGAGGNANVGGNTSLAANGGGSTGPAAGGTLNSGSGSTSAAAATGGSLSSGGSTVVAGGSVSGTTGMVGGNGGITTSGDSGDAATSTMATSVTTIVKTSMSVTVGTLSEAQAMAADPAVEEAFEAVMANATNVAPANVEATLTAARRLLMEEAEVAVRRLAATLTAAFDITVPDGTPASTIANAVVAAGNSTGTLQSALVSQLSGTNFSAVNVTVSSLSAPQTIVVHGTTVESSSGQNPNGTTAPSAGQGGSGGSGGGLGGSTPKPATPTPATGVSGAAMARISPMFCLAFLWPAA